MITACKIQVRIESLPQCRLSLKNIAFVKKLYQTARSLPAVNSSIQIMKSEEAMSSDKDKALNADEIRQLENETARNYPNDSWRLHYHLMPPAGWLNDPNGLSELNGINHIFFQYNPADIKPGAKNYWGHYQTKNFTDYDYLPPALSSDREFDANGVYSGSAVPTPEGLKAYYTGNVKHPGNHDYTHTGREHNTIVAEDFDGTFFNKKTVLMTNADYPEDVTLHVRDPKVFKRDGIWYMVLGARRNDDTGEVLVYSSDNAVNWNLAERIRYKDDFGYMWECPDVVHPGEHDFLVFSPQGLKADGDRFNNVYQTGWALADHFGSHTKLGEFHELDRGFDLYAPQSYVDEDGRTILIGWMGLPDTEPEYTYLTKDRGWMHALTIPRVLTEKNEQLIQTPLPELEQLRNDWTNVKLEGKPVSLPVSQAFEMQITPEESCDSGTVVIREGCTLSWKNGRFTMSFENSDGSVNPAGAGRTIRSAETGKVTNVRVFGDASSLEVFVNGGETVFTTRFFPDDKNQSVSIDGVQGQLDIWDLDSFRIHRPDGTPLYPEKSV